MVCAVSRVKSLLDGTDGKVVVGGETDEKTKYISPTLLVDVELSDAVMKDEVCAPVMSVYCDLTITACLL